MEPLSDSSYIQIKSPSILLQEWVKEGEVFCQPRLPMNLATSTKEGRVSNRNVTLQEILPDASLTFASLFHTTKIQNIIENPKVAATLMLTYVKNGVKNVKQVSVIGEAIQLPLEKCKSYFEEFPFPLKIRVSISEDYKPIEWDKLKKKYNSKLKEVTDDGKVVQMPDSLVAYKIVPSKMIFFNLVGNEVGDRVIFEKDDNDQWKSQRVVP